MKFYYTTSGEVESSQRKKSSSLGGYKSSTVIPNDDLNNLFGDITPFGITQNKPIYIGVMLKNETGSDATGITFYFDYPTDPQIAYSKLEIAIVSLAQDAEGNYYMEHVDTQYSKPYNATFQESNGVGDSISLPDMVADSMLGMWIKRTIDIEAINTDYEDYISKPTGSDLYVQKELDIEDSIDIVIDYTI